MKKLTFEIVKKRFDNQGREDIIICLDGFNGWKKISKFYDNSHGEHFWAIPKNVFNQNSCHPDRAAGNRKKTNLKKYGNACSLHGDLTKEKTKKTWEDKYGTSNPFKSEKVKKKIRETLKRKYGVENPSQIEEVKRKKKETLMKNWGVEHQMHSPIIKKKIKETNLRRYGVEHHSQNKVVKEKKRETYKRKYKVSSPFGLPGVRERASQTMIGKYGTTNSWLNITKTIPELNISLLEWYKRQPPPKPSYGKLSGIFKGVAIISLEQCEKVISDFIDKKTTLEAYAEKLFESKHYNRKPKQLTKLYRPDFKLSSTIFLNVDGLYWHSIIHKDKQYHFELREEFEKCDIRLFQFREDEIYNKAAIVKSIIQNATNETKRKIGARKTKIKKVPHREAALFLMDNHLMGSTKAKHLGLFFADELVSLISFKQGKSVCKIERFCSLKNTSVIGGFSKLLKRIEEAFLGPKVNEIHNWVDLRYGTGDHLASKGFVCAKETLGWKWTDGIGTFNRLQCRANMDPRSLPEKLHAEELGWYRIYDAGQRLWIKTFF